MGANSRGSHLAAVAGRLKTLQRQMRLSALMSRDRARCQHCGITVRVLKLKTYQRQPADMATEDHIRPKCEGGSDEMENLLLACFRCNNDRGNVPMGVFRTLMRGVRP